MPSVLHRRVNHRRHQGGGAARAAVLDFVFCRDLGGYSTGSPPGGRSLGLAMLCSLRQWPWPQGALPNGPARRSCDAARRRRA
jgi:hypothetical protein